MPPKLLLTIFLAFIFTSFAWSEEPEDYFEKKVRPILVENCQECHGKKQKGNLLLDTKANFEKGGESGPVVIKGKPSESRLIQAIGYEHELKMPPRSKLPKEKIDILTRWVGQGAFWPKDKKQTVTKNEKQDWEERKKRWAWQPIKKATPPAMIGDKWRLSGVDGFLLKAMREKGLAPSEKGNKEALLRRLYLDLIGFPPSPETVQRFTNDTRPGEWEREVDLLLASPRFGENWARHWLDLVRYGESRGHEFDYNIPNAFQYRDYVIRAFNSDVPYNQFAVEHLAGDLIPQPRLHPVEKWNESILGTGFLYLGEEVHSPVDIRQDQADRFDNRIDVIGKTFFGLTLACARCHDHKFDPIASRDYYSLFGYLESSDYRLVRFQAWENNRLIAEELKKEREAAQGAIRKETIQSLRTAAQRLPSLAKAAMEVLNDESQEKDKTPDILFENFESDNYQGWKAEGTAFGEGPIGLKQLIRDQKAIRFDGEKLVNTHNQKINGKMIHSDEATGTLTSNPFTVERSFIAFLIGGGAHPGTTCMNLLVDGKVVRTATGKNQNQMFPSGWDVRDLIGKKARFQIVDNEKGSWGHIGVDSIRFTNQGSEGIEIKSLVGFQNNKKLLEISRAQGVSPKHLESFLNGISNSKGSKENALAPFARSLGFKTELQTKPRSDVLGMRLAFLESKDHKPVVDFNNLQAGQWRPDGVSFGMGPIPKGTLRLEKSGGQAGINMAELTAAEFDPFWKGIRASARGESEPGALGGGRAGKTLATPSFLLEKEKVFILAKGKGRVYASVGAHIMISGPLHGQIIKPFTLDDYGWVALDLSRYRGQMVHLEITADSAPFSIVLVGQGSTDPQVKSLKPITIENNKPGLLAQEYQERLNKLVFFLQDQIVSAEAGYAFTREINDWLNAGVAIWGNPKEGGIFEAAEALEIKLNALSEKVQWESELALALWDGKGIDEKVFVRGNHRTPGEPAPRRYLEALHPEMIAQGPGSGRLALASWMTNPEQNPFISRVIVNRVFQHLFGKGVVPTVDNLGSLGENPSNPELLDFLAGEFVNQGWSLKSLIRFLVTSAAYQSSSIPSLNAKEKDPENFYFSYMPTKRIQAESLRDSLLVLGGNCGQQMFGPSVNIYLSGFLEGRGRPPSGPIDGEGKRSIYQSVRRNFLSPMMVAFDAPIPFSTVGRRSKSNVPAQALILMNDPFVHFQSEKWAKRILALEISQQDRIIRMYQEAFARNPSGDELRNCLEFIQAVPMTSEIERWKDFAHALVNAKEFTWLR